MREIKAVRNNRNDSTLRNAALHHGLGELIACEDHHSDGNGHDPRERFYANCGSSGHDSNAAVALFLVFLRYFTLPIEK